MSKVGNNPIKIPSSVTIDLKDQQIIIKGKEGQIELIFPSELSIKKDGDILTLQRKSDSKKVKSIHGLFRSLIANLIAGTEKLWEKRLEIVGTGFNVKFQGEDLILKVGFSHPVIFKKKEGVKYMVEGNNKIVIQGINKQLVGEVAHQIKSIKKPDVYKGKGIRYEGEIIKLKPGKKAKMATAV